VNSSARLFLFCGYVLLILGSIWMAVFDKGTIVLWLNAHYSTFGNYFFAYTTYLGDGLMVAIVAVLMLGFRYDWFGIVATMGIMQLLVIQGLKKFAFGPMERPAAFFENFRPPLIYVEGVDVHKLFTMPSGHTATAFSIAFILVLIFKPGKVTTIGIFLTACLIGASRIYLAQHFLMDTLVGGFLGVLMAFIAFRLFEYLKSKNPEAAFFNKSLRSFKD
jgi:membrane-associated phospholipid phosphatase